ncbi:MAG: nucleoside recognition domain-containing protein [Paludibacteraceae bacterium]
MTNPIFKKTISAVTSALPKAKKTTVWILKIILPISLLVNILQYFGFISIFAHFLTPIFSHIGLPGESAIVFITSIFLPLYAPIAIATTLSLQVREITILAVMCLISHNLLVETAIQKKAGSSYFALFFVRVVSSFVAAYCLNKLLPLNMSGEITAENAVHFQNICQMIFQWGIDAFWLIIKIWLIISGLIILQNILKEFNLLTKLTNVFAPIMGLIGLSRESTFLWLVAHILGLTYGSAVILSSIESNEIAASDADLLNYHIAVNHSTLEDTLLFVAIGVPAIWMIVPRFILAISIVWVVRLVHFLLVRKRFSTN